MVSKDLTACEEFLELVVTAHVVAVAVQTVGVVDTSCQDPIFN